MKSNRGITILQQLRSNWFSGVESGRWGGCTYISIAIYMYAVCKYLEKNIGIQQGNALPSNAADTCRLGFCALAECGRELDPEDQATRHSARPQMPL